MFSTGISKLLSLKNVCLSVTSHFYLGTYVLTPYGCSDTFSRHWHQPCSDTLSRLWNQLRWSWRGGAHAAAVWCLMSAWPKSAYQRKMSVTSHFYLGNVTYFTYRACSLLGTHVLKRLHWHQSRIETTLIAVRRTRAAAVYEKKSRLFLTNTDHVQTLRAFSS